jgi:hypothetical protein
MDLRSVSPFNRLHRVPRKKGRHVPARLRSVLPANKQHARIGFRSGLRGVVLCAIALLASHTVNAGAPGPEASASSTATSPISEREMQNAIATPPNPAARLVGGDDASEYWTLFVDLDSGHRITQRFLLSNAGPGDHNAVAIGHLVEPGRAPYRYENGRRRARWTLSDDHLFLDIAASHLDLHRPTGQLRITKDEIEIRLFFEFPATALAGRVPPDRLPPDYQVEVLAVAAQTEGTIRAPWMNQPLSVRGRTWLAHTWTRADEASLLDRRVEIYGYENGTSFYGLHVRRGNDFSRSWALAASDSSNMVESSINVPASWIESATSPEAGQTGSYPIPGRFDFSRGPSAGQITLGEEWLRFDPLAVIPQPFRWFIRRKTKPREVWADARIGVRLSPTLESPPLPDASGTESDSNSKRETREETAERSVTGVASITFMNPSEGR